MVKRKTDIWKRMLSIALSALMMVSVFCVVPISVGAAIIDKNETGTASYVNINLEDFIVNVRNAIFQNNARSIQQIKQSEETLTVDTVQNKSFAFRMDNGSTEYAAWAYIENSNLLWWSNAEDVFLLQPRIIEDNSSLFENWQNYVKAISFNGFNTSKITNTANWFSNKNFTTIDLTGFDTSNVTDMRGMFLGCRKITSLDVSSFNTSNVTNMQGMFVGCENLASIDVSNFNTSRVTNMQDMFLGCEKLASIDVSSFNTSNVTNMYGMFQDCINLTSLNVSNINTSSVINMGSMFENCSSLTSIDVSSFDTKNLRNISSNYYSGVARMFKNCKNITSLNIDNFNLPKVDSLRELFMGCSSLQRIDLSKCNLSEVESFASLFEDCTNLREVNLSGIDVPNLYKTSWMFSGCENIETIDLSSLDFSHIFDVEEMFNNCKKLKTIYTSGNPNFSLENIYEKLEEEGKLHKEEYNGTTYYSLIGKEYDMSSGEYKTIYSGINVSENVSVFNNCKELVGGNGTVYNSSNENEIYAKIDTDGEPGYFTYKKPLKTSLTVTLYSNSPALVDNVFAIADVGENNQVDAITEIPYAGDDYIFKGWYYGTASNATPVDFENDTFEESTEVYAQWIEVDPLEKDSSDINIVNDYTDFELSGVQIRKEGKLDENLNTKTSAGLRFVGAINNDVLSELDSLSDETISSSGNENRVEYGFVVTKTQNADRWVSYAGEHVHNYKIGYNGTNVNGVDTTKRGENYQGFVTNVDCTASDYSTSAIKDHNNFDNYRLYTMVINYDGAEADKDVDILARSYIRYYDANGVLRTHYNDYEGTNVYGGCSTSYNAALAKAS